MKSLFFTAVTILSFGFLAGCASNTEEAAPAAQQAASAAPTEQAGEQTMDVKSPESSSGQNKQVQNPGAAGASKMISPAL